MSAISVAAASSDYGNMLLLAAASLRLGGLVCARGPPCHHCNMHCTVGPNPMGPCPHFSPTASPTPTQVKLDAGADRCSPHCPLFKTSRLPSQLMQRKPPPVASCTQPPCSSAHPTGHETLAFRLRRSATAQRQHLRSLCCTVESSSHCYCGSILKSYRALRS